jgi:hypothetical protein
MLLRALRSSEVGAGLGHRSVAYFHLAFVREQSRGHRVRQLLRKTSGGAHIAAPSSAAVVLPDEDLPKRCTDPSGDLYGGADVVKFTFGPVRAHEIAIGAPSKS